MSDLTVTLSGDKMMAHISGSAKDCRTINDVIDAIITVLSEQGVVFGVQEHLVSLAAVKILEQKSVQAVIVAIGEYSQPERFAGVHLSVPAYPESMFPPDFEYHEKKPIHFHQLTKYINIPHIVREYEIVGKLISHSKSVSGKNVLGEPDKTAVTAATLSPSENLGQGLFTQYNTSDICSRYTGIVIRKKNCVSVLPVILDAAAFFTLPVDKLALTMDCFPPGPEGKEISRADVLAILFQHYPGVRNIDEQAIESACRTAAKTGGAPIAGAVVASGTPAQKGTDSRVQYFVNLNFSRRPEIMEDGRANYYHIHLFESVNAGRLLARIFPACEGTPGTDVFGNQIPAEKGKQVAVALGKNVEASPSDPSCIVAAKNGHVYLHNETLFIEEVLRIKSNVDFNTGDIHFTGDIEIMGDIKSGFTVKTSGNILVRGAIEDAVVEAGRSVVVQSGFVGSGRGRIKAGDDVVLKFVRNQVVMAQNNIMIEGEAMDSNLYAGNELFVEVKKSWIVGGSAVARNRIRAYAIGNSSGVSTEAGTGIDILARKLLEELEREISALKQEYNIVSINVKQLLLSQIAQGEAPPAITAMQKKLKTIMEKHGEKLIQLNKYKDHYEQSLYDVKGDIGVTDSVYPGVVVKIGHLTHTVKDELKGCLFFVNNGRISCRSL
jgi:uncharacterized protein (DUF342 family)